MKKKKKGNGEKAGEATGRRGIAGRKKNGMADKWASKGKRLLAWHHMKESEKWRQ